MASTPGITARHSLRSAVVLGARCNCDVSFEAWVWSKRDGKKVSQTFSGKGALSAARHGNPTRLEPSGTKPSRSRSAWS